MHVNLRKD